MLYQAAKNRNDFFLLHGVTSAWALEQVLPLIQDRQVAMGMVRTFLAGLFGLYLVRHRPKLVPDLLIEPEDVEEWEQVMGKVLALPPDTDEHVFKLAHVCRSLAFKTDDDDEDALDLLCRRSVLTVLQRPFVVYPEVDTFQDRIK